MEADADPDSTFLLFSLFWFLYDDSLSTSICVSTSTFFNIYQYTVFFFLKFFP